DPGRHMDDTTRLLKSSARSERGKESLRLWLRLLSCERAVEQRVRSLLREQFGVTLPQFDVLSELERSEGPLTMTQLSTELMVSNGNITGLIDRLERDGLVRRTPSKGDRRVQYIELTAKGSANFRAIARAHETWVTQLFGGLTQTELRALQALLLKARRSA